MQISTTAALKEMSIITLKYDFYHLGGKRDLLYLETFVKALYE